MNPAHRVKSICLSSFTHEEMDLVQSRGNDLCRLLYPDSGDGRQTRASLSAKYATLREPSAEILRAARAVNEATAGDIAAVARPPKSTDAPAATFGDQLEDRPLLGEGGEGVGSFVGARKSTSIGFSLEAQANSDEKLKKATTRSEANGVGGGVGGGNAVTRGLAGLFWGLRRGPLAPRGGYAQAAAADPSL